MKNLVVSLLLICNIGLLFSQNDLPQDTIKKMYKRADIIFTAVVVHETVVASTVGEERRMIDFDITEIQKGRDYSRLLVYTLNDTTSFIRGKEYLVFAQMNKHENRYQLFYSEQVCKSCTNYTIRKVYEIIDKTPFATIKKPREKTPWHERGCGCH